MANIFAANAINAIRHACEYGNTVTHEYTYTGAGPQNDKIYFGQIPAGTRVTNVRLIADDCGTSVTLDLGYSPVDGSSPTEDLTAWFSNRDVATAAVDAVSGTRPVTLDRDVWLVGTIEGAAFTGTPTITVIVQGVSLGIK